MISAAWCFDAWSRSASTARRTNAAVEILTKSRSSTWMKLVPHPNMLTARATANIVPGPVRAQLAPCLYATPSRAGALRDRRLI